MYLSKFWKELARSEISDDEGGKWSNRPAGYMEGLDYDFEKGTLEVWVIDLNKPRLIFKEKVASWNPESAETYHAQLNWVDERNLKVELTKYKGGKNSKSKELILKVRP